MDNPDPRNAVKAAFAILRKATRIVQLAPFAYLCFYAVYLLVGSLAEDNMLSLADSLMMLSPITTIGFLVASRLFKLCAWHKIACLLPSASQVEGYIDSFVFQFTQQEIIFINAALGLLAIVYVIAAIKHFYGCKRTDPANA